MNSNIFETDDNSTPLTEEEVQGLIPSWVTLRSELNELESLGILNAEKWLLTIRRKDLLSEKFIKLLHKKMFEGIWLWAGKFRTTERNIGIAPYAISVELQKLFDDVNYWVRHETYPIIEIGARFHHRLVYIHPFPNGNGRHSRLMADLLMKKLKHTPLNWGQGNLIKISELRKKYINALQKADKGDYSLLLEFVQG
ncbi:MAG: mobile mystery protein B [Candidatus Gastranaerophilaceae bacterium]